MWHEQHLQQAMQPGSIAFEQHRQALASFFTRVAGGPNSGSLALAQIYNQLNNQAHMQGYQDVYMQLSWMSVVLILFAFMLSKNRPGTGAGGGAMH
jgi:DHA2 family multidrug resistance protein